MPRKPRVEYPGAVCHVMSRGDQGEDIFLDDVDRQSRRCGSETLAMKAIAVRVHLGTSKSANVRLRKWMGEPAPSNSTRVRLGI